MCVASDKCIWSSGVHQFNQMPICGEPHVVPGVLGVIDEVAIPPRLLKVRHSQRYPRTAKAVVHQAVSASGIKVLYCQPCLELHDDRNSVHLIREIEHQLVRCPVPCRSTVLLPLSRGVCGWSWVVAFSVKN